MLAVCFLVLWEQLNFQWISSCTINDGSDDSSSSSDSSSSNSSSWMNQFAAINPFNFAFKHMADHINNYSCTVVQYIKILSIVGGSSVLFCVVSYVSSFRISIVATCAILMGILREHLRSMFSRAIYDVPLIIIFHFFIFWPLQFRCCHFGENPSIEWEKWGIAWRPIVVSLCLPCVCFLFSFVIGLHMTCDMGGKGESTTECASNLFASLYSRFCIQLFAAKQLVELTLYPGNAVFVE